MTACSASQPKKLKRPLTQDHAPGDGKRNGKRAKTSEDGFLIRTTPAFWDNLSKIWLTRGALQELGQRQESLRTRTVSPVPAPLLTDIPLEVPPRFARQGSPRIDDLRGVCATICAITKNRTDRGLVPRTHDYLSRRCDELSSLLSQETIKILDHHNSHLDCEIYEKLSI